MAIRTFILCALNTFMLTSTLAIFKFALAVTFFSMKINLIIQNPICSCRDWDGFTNFVESRDSSFEFQVIFPLHFYSTPCSCGNQVVYLTRENSLC